MDQIDKPELADFGAATILTEGVEHPKMEEDLTTPDFRD